MPQSTQTALMLTSLALVGVSMVMTVAGGSSTRKVLIALAVSTAALMLTLATRL